MWAIQPLNVGLTYVGMSQSPHSNPQHLCRNALHAAWIIKGFKCNYQCVNYFMRFVCNYIEFRIKTHCMQLYER
jgi:hypothetical protein